MVPQEILDRQTELNELVHEHPETIPIDVLAKFLRKDKDILRASLERGSADFGFSGVTNPIKGNRFFAIPTYTFYAWYTKGVIFDVN